MKFIEFFSNIAMPLMIIIIVLYGVVERQKVFDIFLEGAKEGISIVFNIFPTLVGLFMAIGALRSSGVIDLIVNLMTPIFNLCNFPTEILPLALIRPISGSSSIAVATDIMKNFGVDSNIGFIASVIMGSTETTVYTIAVYSSSIGIKKTRFVLWAALIADFVGIVTSVVVCRLLS
ncbi:MAG: spore maturation protein [Clostridia bacterium]|nr:spore maturation protein [Clostridia bacterium]